MSDLIKKEVQETISEIARLRKRNLEIMAGKESFLDVIFLLDTSSSMDGVLPDGKRKIEHLKKMIADLNIDPKHYISFNTRVFPYSLTDAEGCTDLEEAFDFLKTSNIQYKKVLLISDGEPTSEHNRTIEAAKRLKVPVDVLYIGPAGGFGEKFMERLCLETQGNTLTTSGSAQLLEQGVVALLGEGVVKEDSIKL